MIKFIASDIDGTLLCDGRRTISDRFFAEASRLMDAGVVVCAASGRQYQSLADLFAPIADRMYFLCENGAAVFGPGMRLISHTPIDRTLSLELCNEILALPDCELLVSGKNTSYLCPKTRDYEDHIRYFVGNNVEILPNPEAMPEEFLKISAYYRAGSTLIEPILAPKWRNHMQAAIAGACWLDFTLADKSTGIRALLRELNIAPEDAMAFGDNYNDIPMLDSVGHPYLMSSAAEPLRKRYPTQCNCVEDVLETVNV